ncbi:MAG TPA: tetratricopeptide repeat protein [Thermoanaerobaculia bacterium]|nr:tetratricopeptide repeat protein [Thermoanaerobaculia bacterium]
MSNTGVSTEKPGVSTEKRVYRFDEFSADPLRRLLLRDGAPVAVTPKSLSILLILLEKRGEVVDKDELIGRVWPDTFVTEANLTQNVSALRKALGEKANDHRYVVTMPGRGYSFVADVVELPEALETAGSPAPEPEPPPEPIPEPPGRWSRWRRPFLAGLAAAMLLAALVAVPVLLRDRLPALASPAASKAQRTSVAVLGFKDLSGKPGSAWLAPALTEMLTTELAAGGRVRVVPGETVARARKTLESDALDSEALGRLHTILASDLLVTGSYLVLPGRPDGQIRLDIQVIHLPDGETASSLAEVGTEPELFDLVARTGAKLRGRLGLQELSPEQEREARALQPSNPEAARLYAQGLEKLHASRHLEAVKLLQQAAGADPRSASIHAALSQTWAGLGYDARAAGEARQAIELSDGLPRPERLAIQARFYGAGKQWSRASEIYRSLWTFYPDDLEYGLQLATALYLSGNGSEALATLAELRKLPPPSGLDSRIDFVEAKARFRLSDLPGAVQSAAAAEAKGHASGERLMEAQALVVAGQALTVEGRKDEAIRAFEKARTLFAAEGDEWGVCSALANHGILLYRQGDLAGSERLHLQALALARKVGNVTGLAAEYGNLSLLYQDRGDLPRALDYLKLEHEQLDEMEEPFLKSRALSGGAVILRLQGDLAGARARLEEAAALGRKMRSPSEEARALHNLASVLVWSGQVREAGRQAERAYRLVEDRRDLVQASSSLAAWADVAARLGDLETARKRYDEALALRRQAGDRIGIGQLLGSMACLQSLAGDLPGARARSEEQFRMALATESRTLHAWSLQGLARSRAAAGFPGEARQLLRQALSESTAMSEHLRAMLVRVDLAKLALDEPDGAEPAARLAGETAAWFRQRGNSWGEAEASAVLAQALARQGKRAEALAAVDRVRGLTDRGEDRALALSVAPRLALARALVGALAGENAEARIDAAGAAEEAQRRGFVVVSLEARLVQGWIETEQGDPGGRKRIEEVRKEAQARGLGLLVRHADEALSPSVQHPPLI